MIFQQSNRHLELAVKSQPDHLPQCRPPINFEQKNLAKVQSIITKALREFDANATVYFWRLNSAFSSNLTEASASIEKAIALDPNQSDLLLALEIIAMRK